MLQNRHVHSGPLGRTRFLDIGLEDEVRHADYIRSRSLGAQAGGSFAGPYVSDFERAAGLDADQLIDR